MDAVIDAYRADGYAVEVIPVFETFAQLAVADPARIGRKRLAANWPL